MALCSAMLLFVVGAQAQAQSLLTHHMRPAVTSGQAKFLNRLPETQTLRLDIVLPLRDQAGLEKFLQEVYDPTSPSYRHFLTVPEFTARFGPTQEDYDAVIRFAKSNGFKVVGGSRDGMDVQIEGSVTSIEAAFNVSMGVYQHPTENRTFYAPDREPTVALPFPLWHISGLDNYSIPHPLLVKKSDYAKAMVSIPNRRAQRHDGLRPLGLFPGQRHARGLLRRNGPDRRRPEPRIARVLRHRSGRLDHLFQQRRSNQQCADHPALHGRNQHQLRVSQAAATTPNRRST